MNLRNKAGGVIVPQGSHRDEEVPMEASRELALSLPKGGNLVSRSQEIATYRSFGTRDDPAVGGDDRNVNEIVGHNTSAVSH